MKRAILPLLLLLGVGAFAQPKDFSIEQATMGQGREFAPKTLRGLAWRGSSVTYVEDGKIKEVDPKTGTITEVASFDALGKVTGKDFKVLRADWLNTNALLLTGNNTSVCYDLVSKQVKCSVSAPASAENFTLAASNDKAAFTVNDNLFIINGTEQIQVTNDGGKGIVNGKSVHRNEFGIKGGIFWSPKGNCLAFYRMDESMVSEYPIVDITKRVAELRPERYPMAGMASHQVKVGVYNLKSGKTVFLETGAPYDRFFTNICWSPDERYILVAEINRGQNEMKLNKYDARNGMYVATLFEEKSDKWTEPEHPAQFLTKNPTQFVWQSPRDGWNHLYLYNINGKMIRQITKGNWEVSDVKEITPDDRYIYYTSTAVSPLERHLYRVEVKSGKTVQLTCEKGTHNVIVNYAAGMIIDQYSSLDVSNVINIKAIDKPAIVRNLVTAKNPYEGFHMGQEKFIKTKTSDGKFDLYGRIILPADFDSTKKYPVIVYVYGGPHLQLVTDSWLGGARLWEFYMAQKGYILFTLDNRGTPARGNEFYQAIHRKLGTVDVDDQMQGIAFLKSLPYVDADRIGVHGWSYGGFMTTSLMCKHPETFKVGVAGAPVIDWKYYEVMYGERYMDTPQENPDGYASASLLNNVKGLKGDLLIIHSDYDVTVVWQNTLNFIRDCVSNNIPVDYFVYPQHEHNVRGKDRVHLMTKITKYFDDNLKK
ncbi:DPP IV N-terminal domain-containing protein [uncultured Acetobacteroides sp.]|uniref:S9 family peptidase n=1 Tax=uncultured Acetobacteroides sp. TaxID=1760811 RepID=UPI0029F55F3D|nr:DPP IV N-terminal domain-containing protein [uncultured Acetobacteroides sp.]